MRSCVYAAALLALLAGVSVPDLLGAQLIQQPTSNGALFDAGVASIKIDGYALASLTDVASSLWGRSGRLSGTGTASLARFETGSATGYGELHGSIALSPDPRNLSAIRVDGGGGAYRGEASSRYAEASLMLGRSIADGAIAGWLDGGVGRMNADSSRTTSHARVGGSVRSARAMIGAEFGTFASGSIRYSDALIHAQLAPAGGAESGIARLIVGLDAGLRASDDVKGRHAWAAGVATVRVAGPVSLVGFAGAQPADPTRGTLGAAFTSVGLRVALGGPGVARSPPPPLTTAPRRTSVSAPADDGRRMISVALESARTVDVMGDFTAWSPVAMTRSATGIWQVRIPVEEGSHRMEIRADSGAWIPAPGLPVVADEFGGSVGILVVQ